MYTSEALLDVHERAHRNLADLLTHCCGLDAADADRELDGFGYPTVRLQLHHAFAGERYWVGVLEGRIDVEEDAGDYTTIASLEPLRRRVFEGTRSYLRSASSTELGTPRPMITWGGHERELMPARVIVRTVTHLYDHKGQIVAMCRLLGNPSPSPGFDFPIL